MVLTAITLPDGGLFMLQGYATNEAALQRFQPAEGVMLSGNRQIMLGRIMASSLSKKVGVIVDLSGKRFKVVGIFETGVSWEEMGGLVSLRDAQAVMGKPRQ